MNNKKLFLFIIAILTSLSALSQRLPAPEYWTGGTALTLPDNRFEIKLFGLSSYGLTDRLEISAHPLMVWLMPQVRVKYRWSGKDGLILASEHQISYPTLLLDLISRKGIGGMISPEFDFPQMISISNGLLVSAKLGPSAMVTGNAAILFALRTGPVEENSTIDLPVIYPRLAAYYHSPVINTGFEFRGKLFSSVGGQIGAECFIIPGDDENIFAENKGVLTWTLRTRWQFQAGYRLCYGKYPFGSQWHLLPAFEIINGF